MLVCGFNNYLGINEEYDSVNESMYFDNLVIKKSGIILIDFTKERSKTKNVYNSE